MNTLAIPEIKGLPILGSLLAIRTKPLEFFKKIANENELKTIAFPNISTGIYRFPKLRAAEIAIEAVKIYRTGTEMEK